MGGHIPESVLGLCANRNWEQQLWLQAGEEEKKDTAGQREQQCGGTVPPAGGD